MKLDPIQVEIFFHKFTAITEEMAITLQRTARTTYVKEAGDFGTSIATPAGGSSPTRPISGCPAFSTATSAPRLPGSTTSSPVTW